MSTDQPRTGAPDPAEHPTESFDAASSAAETAPLDLSHDAGGNETQQFETEQFETRPFETQQFETQQFEQSASPQDDRPDILPLSSTPAPTAAPAVGPTTSASSAPVGTGSTAVLARPALRVGTVVWGLVLAIIGACLLAVAAGAQIDLELAFIALLTLAGIGLLVGSLVTSARRRSR